MKKITTLFLILIANFSFGQVTSSSVPVSGDTFMYKKAGTPVIVPTKQNGIFDFSSLTPLDSSLWIYEKITSPLYPTANLLFTQTDAFEIQLLFNSSKSNLYIVSMNNLPLPPEIKLSQELKGSLVYMTYPFTLTTTSNTSDSMKAVISADSSILGVNIDTLLGPFLGPILPPGSTFHVDSIYITMNFNLKLSADQSGKVTTPYDTAIDCIRIVRSLSTIPEVLLGIQVKTLLGNIYIKYPATSFAQAFIPDPSILTQVQHLYYSPKYRSEVVQGTLDSSNGKEYTSVYYRQKTAKDIARPSSILSSGTHKLQFGWNDNSIEIEGKKSNEQISVQLFDIMGRKHLDYTTRNKSIPTETIEKNQLYILKYSYLGEEGSLKFMH